MHKDQSLDEQVESRDEMNLAELPVTLLSERSEPGQKTVTFTDTISVRGKPRKRTVTITGSDKCGLPTAKDNDVIAGLLLLSYEQGYMSSTVEFTSYSFIQKLGWPDHGQSYTRLKEALERLTGVTITTDGWWDNKTKSHRTKIFHIIDQVTFADPKDKEESSEFTWSRAMFASIRANNIKYLDFGLWRSLQTQIAKRLYRLLDKRFYKADHVRYNLFELCHEKIGLSRNLKYRSNLIQKLTQAINELKDVDFIRKVEFVADDVTFYRGAGSKNTIHGEMENETQTNTRIATNNRKPRVQQEKPSEPKDRLINNLVERGVNRRWASKYLRDASNEAMLRIEDLIEYFDRIVKMDKTKVKSPGGFLRTMIEENWTLPPNFQSSRRWKEQEKANEKPISTGPHIDILAEDKAYQTWWNAEVDKAISTKPKEAVETLKTQVREEMHRRFSKELDRWTLEMRTEFFQQTLRKRVANELKLIGFKEWLQGKGLTVPECLY